MTQEIRYAVIPGFEDYYAGSDGSIWSAKKGRDCFCWKRMKQSWCSKHCRRTAALCMGGKKKRFFTHQLIMLAFYGPCPEGKEVAHNNGIASDNNLANLRYDTHKGNHSDRKRHGTNNEGETNGQAVLTDEKVLEMRARRSRGEKIKTLVSDYGIGRRGVERIIRGERWGHLK